MIFRKIKSLFKVACYLVIIAVLVVVGLSEFVKISTMGSIKNKEKAGTKADCILVLGAGVNGTDPSDMLKDRLDTAIELYKNGFADRILMSGDHGSIYYNEVGVMKAYAIENGVPSEKIFMDHAGFSTSESISRAYGIFGCNSIIAVTQRYHLYRTLYLAKSKGINVVGVCAERHNYKGQLYREIREILARDKDLCMSVLGKNEKKYSESIPITGNGDVTNDTAFYRIIKRKKLNMNKEK